MAVQHPFQSRGETLLCGSEPLETEGSDDAFWDIHRDELYDQKLEEAELVLSGSNTHIGHIDSLAKKVESFILGIYPTSLASKVVQQALSYIMTPRVLPATASLNPYLQYWLALFSALLSASLSPQTIHRLLDGGGSIWTCSQQSLTMHHSTVIIISCMTLVIRSPQLDQQTVH